MKRVTNEYLKKEMKKVNNNLIIGIVCALLAAICIGLGYYDSTKEPKDTTYFNDIIVGEEANRIDKEVNLKITEEPIRFARLTNSNKRLYIVTDSKYYYIISLTDSQYNKLMDKKPAENAVTIYGKTKATTSSIEKLATNYYNSSESIPEEKKINDSEDFFSIFGDLYLDTTEQSAMSIVLYIIGAICSMLSTIFLIIFGVMKFKVERALKKIDDEELKKIEAEMEEKEAFHYEKARLILTKTYIVSFLNGLTVLKYEDIIWVYEHRLKQYGMTTQKSIMVMNNKGKVKPIITLDGITKKSKLVFDEIADTILSKNNKILVGYTKENRKKIKEDYNF